jgi:competence protein ComEC
VLVYVPADDYSVGQILYVEGKIALFETAANEGGFDEKNYYQSQKIDFGLDAGQVHLAAEAHSSYPKWLSGLRERMQQVLLSSVEDDGVLSAMVLGEKSQLDADVRALYQKAGISHILAISGLHVSLLGMGLYRLLRRCHATYLQAGSVTAFFVVSYGILTGNSVSTRRAILMLLLALLSDLLGRGYDLLSGLGLAVLVLLGENPFLTGNLGFLFSVVAVLGIGVGNEVLAIRRAAVPDEKTRSAPQKRKQFRERLRQFAGQQLEGLWISLVLQLFTVPLVAYFY